MRHRRRRRTARRSHPASASHAQRAAHKAAHLPSRDWVEATADWCRVDVVFESLHAVVRTCIYHLACTKSRAATPVRDRGGEAQSSRGRMMGACSAASELQLATCTHPAAIQPLVCTRRLPPAHNHPVSPASKGTWSGKVRSRGVRKVVPPTAPSSPSRQPLASGAHHTACWRRSRQRGLGGRRVASRGGGASAPGPTECGLRRLGRGLRRLGRGLRRLARPPHETATGLFRSSPVAQACSSTRSRKEHTRALSSRASKGGMAGGGSIRLGAKTTVRLLSVMRF